MGTHNSFLERKAQDLARLTQTAFFVLQTAAARAEIIAANFVIRPEFWGSFCCRFLIQHLAAPLLCDLFHERTAVVKKTPVTCTQVVQTCFSVRRLDKAVLWALAVAHGPDLTLQAVAGERVQFSLPECSLFRTLQQFD